MPTIDEMLNDFEKRIRVLKIEYDVFFVGGKKTPPTNLRQSLETLIQRLLEEQHYTFAQKFRFNTLVARYNAYRELWRKKTAEKEEKGILRDEKELQQLIEHGLTQAQAEDKPKDEFTFVTDDPARHRDQAREFFKFIQNAHLSVSGQPFKTDFEKFFDLLQVKTSELCGKYKSPAVEFQAVIDRKENKVKFSAKVKKT